MEKFIPESPKIKYMIPKVQPSFFSLSDGNSEINDINEKNEFQDYDESREENKEIETKDDYIKEKSLDSLNENSIFKTLLLIVKKKESMSSIETRDSF